MHCKPQTSTCPVSENTMNTPSETIAYFPHLRRQKNILSWINSPFASLPSSDPTPPPTHPNMTKQFFEDSKESAPQADLRADQTTSETTDLNGTNLVSLLLADARPAGVAAKGDRLKPSSPAGDSPSGLTAQSETPSSSGKTDRLIPTRTIGDGPKGLDPSATKPAVDTGSDACPANPEYQRYIDFVAREIYDPASMGDLEKLRNKYNCEIANGGDPFHYAKEAFDKDDDPYTSIMTPAQFDKMLESQRGKEVGPGVVLRMPTAGEGASGQPPPIIVQEFEKTPGRTQELKPGDEILAIDNQSMKGKSWRDALKFFDGKENTVVNVKVLRDGKEMTVPLKRTNEEIPAVTSKTVDDGNFAHIRMRTFMQNDTSEELERAILEHPNAKGYILDLRHNGGGLLDQAFTSASVFMKEGDVLTVRMRQPSDPSAPRHKTTTYKITPDQIQTIENGGAPRHHLQRHEDRVHKPVVVLTDQGTASAAEILAGALKDSDGAYVIGTPTWGKGVGQSIISDWQSGGAVKMTTFHYFTPKGTWPGDGHHNRIGLKPDLYVANPVPNFYGTAQDGQMNAAIDFLRRKTAVGK